VSDPRTLSAGVVVVRRIEGEPRYLLLRAYRYWDFPKGEVAPEETPLQAALREVREETSLGNLRLRWGEAYVETAPYGRNKVARYYVGESARGQVHLPVNPELGRPEHHEFRWLSREAARGKLNARLRGVLDWASRRIGDRSAPTH